MNLILGEDQLQYNKLSREEKRFFNFYSDIEEFKKPLPEPKLPWKTEQKTVQIKEDANAGWLSKQVMMRKIKMAFLKKA